MSQQVAWIFFFFQAEDGIRDVAVTGVQTCALPIYGDFHAIGSAHNLLAALVDAHLFHGNELHLDPNQIAWPRALDMNDRALRHITLSLDSKKEGAGRQGGFLITAASEIMAIVALAKEIGRASCRERV